MRKDTLYGLSMSPIPHTQTVGVVWDMLFKGGLPRPGGVQEQASCAVQPGSPRH